ncbi:MAG: CHASE2 domain-containing protein, partial [Candidatus Neomarinimicrobiota bacterium]
MAIKKFFIDHGAGFLWTGASILLATILHSVGLFDLLNYKVLDFSFAQIRGPLAGMTAREPIERDSLKVVIVDIDDESWRLVPYPWPYPRDAIWSRVIRNLTDAGAKVIAFDIEFDSPDKRSSDLEELNRQGYDIEFRHGDDVLADAIRYAQAKGTRIVLASKLVHEPTRMPPEYIMTPVERIMNADPEPGLINELKDFDGTTRKYALFYAMEHDPGTWYLPLGLKALKEYWQLPDTTLPTLNLADYEITYG